MHGKTICAVAALYVCSVNIMHLLNSLFAKSDGLDLRSRAIAKFDIQVAIYLTLKYKYKYLTFKYKYMYKY